MDFRRRMTLRNLILEVGNNEGGDGGTSSIMCCQSSSSGFERNFRRMALRIKVEPFGAITTGHSVEWIQQTIDNTVSVIFMVTVMGSRILFEMLQLLPISNKLLAGSFETTCPMQYSEFGTV